MAVTPNNNNAFLPNLCTTRAVLVVVVVSELMAIVITLVAGYFESFDIERLALSSLFIQWVGLTSAGLVCHLRDRLNRLPSAWSALAVVGLVVLDTLAFSLLARGLLGWASDGVAVRALWHWDILSNVLIAAIVAGLIMRYFYVQEQLRLKERAELRSRIQALQSRIRPHFLFNSMNIIASLVRVDPDAAEQAVEDLSRLFRASLRDSSEHQVSLAEELSLCRRYTRIEGLRLGERLQVEWRVELDPESVFLPLLTLQPLLENAIYHGIQPLAEGGLVTVHARREGSRVVIGVRNPRPDRDSGHRGNRMALDNIRHRLEALYGAAVRVEAMDEQQYFEVRISYPSGERTG